MRGSLFAAMVVATIVASPVAEAALIERRSGRFGNVIDTRAPPETALTLRADTIGRTLD